MWLIHNLDPVLFSIGPFSVRYYGLAYALGLLAVPVWLAFLKKQNKLTIKYEHVDSLIMYLMLGVVLGGRLGYMIFYNLSNLFTLETFYIWQGGMSFHGGLLGVVLALFIFGRVHKYRFTQISDMIIIPTCIGLFLGRIANFINGEVVGRVSNVPWCVVFPRIDDACRHPSQLYEAAKNIAMLTVFGYLQYFKTLKEGVLTAYFLIGYGTLRFLITFLRDDPLYFGLSEGQYLSLLTAVAGVIMLCWVEKRRK